MSRGPTLPPALQQALSQSTRRWQALAPRERTGASLAIAALTVLLLWSIAIAPALKTLRTVPAQRAELEGQLAQMHALAQEARELRALPPVPSRVVAPGSTSAASAPPSLSARSTRSP